VDSTLHTGGNDNSSGPLKPHEDSIMQMSINTWDSTGEIYELGLMAAASPDFAEAMVLRLLKEAAENGTPATKMETPTTAAA
jgi:hypothetical protein